MAVPSEFLNPDELFRANSICMALRWTSGASSASTATQGPYHTLHALASAASHCTDFARSKERAGSISHNTSLDQVHLCGSFTRWVETVPMAPMESSPGVFAVVVHLPPG